MTLNTITDKYIVKYLKYSQNRKSVYKYFTDDYKPLSFNMSLCKYLHTFTDNRHNKTDNFNFTIENFKHFSYKSSLKKKPHLLKTQHKKLLCSLLAINNEDRIF